MRKYIILFFSVLLFLFSCSDTPSGIIKPEEMATLLTDIHTADGTIIGVSQAPDSLYKYGTAQYIAVFKKFHVDSAQFRKSYKYYTTQPDKLQAIYDQILKNLQKKNDSLTVLLAKQNTSTTGKKPLLPTVQGKMMPQSPVQGKGEPGNPAATYKMGTRPGLPQNVYADKAAAFSKLKARQDSLRKKHSKHKNALPKK